MHLKTSLPFPCTTFKHWTPEDVEATIIIVKGTFALLPDGTLGVAPDQAEIAETDLFWGDVNASSLKAEQEIAPFKPRTDVTINAVARSPKGQAARDWPVSVEVPGRAFYEFFVRGPCEWRKAIGTWSLTDPEPVTEVPIRYELAYGGAAPGREGPELHEFNPVGRGFVTDTLLAQSNPIPAPQIGDLAEFIAADIKAPMTVHGLGPIAKPWLPRRSLAGTFDEAWQATRHPRMPGDFSLAYWNAAPGRLQFEPHLTGAEQIVLRGLHPASEPIVIKLPNLGVGAHKDTPDGPMARLSLTDILVDIGDPDASQHRVTLIWRALFVNISEVEAVHLAAAYLEDTPK